MIAGLLLLGFVVLGNLALGFFWATVLGYGPLWVERRLPKCLRGDAAPPVSQTETAAHH
jgi:hypothetical protein